MNAIRRSVAGAGLVALLAPIVACAAPGFVWERCERELPPVWDPPAHAAAPLGEGVAALPVTVEGQIDRGHCVRAAHTPVRTARLD